MTYLYVGRKSGRDLRLQIGDNPPNTIRQDGEIYELKSSPKFMRIGVVIPEHHKATTYAGAKGDENYARHARVNAEIAEGLANGTMEPPKDREVFGEEMPREAKVDFNRRYDAAKGRTTSV